MEKNRIKDVQSELIELARQSGADLAGIANVSDLREGFSERLFPVMKDDARDKYAELITTGLPHGRVKWNEEEKSVLVFALAHPEEKPEMDWWYGEINPPGNKLLMEISAKIRDYLKEKMPEIAVYSKPYHVERGGIYLKDAAVIAGLGCIGKNNLLITPQFGPRIRLRAIGLSLDLPSTGPLEFEPCKGCPAPCKKACPQNAFKIKIYTPEETGIALLPGRDGSYNRKSCSCEMLENENTAPLESAPEYSEEKLPVIRYCRACELNCVVGKKN